MKAVGYVISIFSVILLGIVAWQSTVENPELKPYLIAGMATSIVGMLLRFASHEKERHSRLRSSNPEASHGLQVGRPRSEPS